MAKLTFDSLMPFGKHKNKPLKFVSHSYLRFVRDNCKNVELDNIVLSALIRSEPEIVIPRESKKQYTQHEQTLIRQYKSCAVDADYSELKRNNLDLEDIYP
jgi:hypothetical protein